MNATTELWDWRRRMADLYAAIRRHADPEAAWRMWRETRATLFQTHAQSPIAVEDRAGFRGPEVFAYDPSLRLHAGLAPAPPEVLELPVGGEGVVHIKAFARTDGLRARLGGELTLYWIEGYGGGTFLPFADRTSGRETYGPGRYLLDTIKGADLGVAADGRMVLDFNFAYFPSCAHSARYVCPLAPLANRLRVAVTAGERNARA
jgi:uncharacterized protein (DUF1684 family)